MTSLALLIGVAGPAAGAVRPKLSEEGKKRRPKTQKVQTVDGHVLKAQKAKLPGESGTPLTAKPPKPSWPAGGKETVKLTAPAAGQRSAAPWVQAGKLPVWLTAPAARPGARAADPVPPEVTVRVVGQETARAARTDGMIIALGAGQQGRIKVGLNYSAFRSAHGGDWASRLRLVRLPACALTTPAERSCQKGSPIPTANDPKAGTLSADVDVPQSSVEQAPMVLAAEAGPSGPGGDWTATKLTPASTWSAGSNTGEFSWSYPMRVPPVPGDLTPEPTFSYNSGAADGKTAADNSQASSIGDGFDYWPGSIERKYSACMDEGHTSGDLCWARNNAVVSLNGRSTELFYDTAADKWRMKNDDGSIIERLTGAVNGDNDGEHWRITTLDGIQYIFGKDRPDDWTAGKTETNSAWTVPVYGDDAGEPCHESTFKDSSCNQAYRWNLDHVIDPHNNTITYYYGKETNNYTRFQQTSGGTKYVSGGYLKRIDYGQRQGSTYAEPATARVRFEVADRTDFPDDQVCADGADCGMKKLSPTFFERKRLTKITTELLTAKTAGTYSPVDEWELGQTYQNGALWLNTINQTGKYGGSTAAPTVTLTAQLMTNRVVSDRNGSGVESIPAHYRPRLVGISSGTGSTTSISYSDPYPVSGPADPAECRYVAGAMPSPKANTKRCFPVKWRDPGGRVIDDWYHKYVVTSVGELDNTGMSRAKVTGYNYLGGGAWRYTEDDGLTKGNWRNWSQWRGYSKVRTIVGSGSDGEEQSRTEATYARGMDGNYQGKGVTPSNVKVTDFKNLLGGIEDIDALAGSVIETRTFNGSFFDADEVSASVSRPKWTRTISHTFKDEITDDDITVHGGWVKPDWTKTRTRQAAGSDRYAETFYHYNNSGQTVAVDDEGDPGTTDDDTCTRTVYPGGPVFSGILYIWSLPIRVLKVAVDCDNPASHEPNLVAADMISDTKTIYDDGAYGDPPTKGNDRQVETGTGVSDGRSTVAKTVTNVHDRYGRVTSTTQVGDPSTTADDRTTQSAYDDAPEGWLKSSTVTTPPISVGGAAAAGFTTTTEYHPARGTPIKVTDPNNRVAEAAYDGLGRIVKAWLPNNPRGTNPDRPSTTYSYALPAGDNPVSITTRTLQKTSPVTYDTSVELLDGLLRPRQTQTEAIGGGRLVTDTKYDSRGLVFKSNAAYPMAGDPSGALSGVDDNQVPALTLAAYDGVGRPTVSTLYNYSTRKWATTTQHNGEQTITIPPSGAMPTMTITDARGRPVETRQFKSGTLPVGGSYSASKVNYDGAGRAHEYKDAAGNTWKTTYDVQGRPATTADPDKGLTTLTYDHFDQVKTIKDARGKILTNAYDVLGRPTTVKDGAALLTEINYDTLAKGLPTSSTRHLGDSKYVTEVRGYDTLYRSTGSRITIPPSEGALAGTYLTKQTYNFDGSPSVLVYPAVGGSNGLPEETLETFYNSDGLPTWNTGLATYVADTSYNAYGDVTQLSMAAVSDKFIWHTFDRDEATKRLTRATVKRQSSTNFYDVETKYQYTDSGSIIGIDTKVGTEAPDRQCFNYDYAQRLKDAWSTTATTCEGTTPSASTIGGPAPYWTTYDYDPGGNYGDKAGNRTKETQHAFTGGPAADKTRAYTYPGELGSGTGNEGPHALKSLRETEGTNDRTDLYTYDQSGNTTARPGQKLNWDAEGHLSQVTSTAKPTDSYEVTNLNSGKCLNVAGASSDNGANVIQWECIDVDDNQWKLEHQGGDQYSLKNVRSGKCADISGWSTANGGDIIQWDCHGGDNQVWTKTPVSGGYKFVSKHSGKCLEVGGWSTANGGDVVQWDCHGGANQTWQLKPTAEIASFIYDASGNRLIREDTNGKTLYLPGQEIKLPISGVMSAVRYYGHDGQTVAYRTGTSSSSVQFLIPDYQGTADTTINAVNQSTWSVRRFAPFGTERTNAAGTWPQVIDKGFVGGTKDSTTNLTHLGAREYDPSVGRFISIDPILNNSDPNSWNGYNYANNSPITNSDPDGKLCYVVDGKHECFNADGNHDRKPTGGTDRPGSYTNYVAPPAPPVKPPCTSWVCKAGKFLKKHSATIVATTVSVAVGVGCGAAVGWTGVGAVGCAAAAGAVYGAVYHGMSTPRDQLTATGFLKSAAIGAVTGVLTAGAVGLAAKVAAPIIKKVAPRITAKITGGGRRAAAPAKGAGGACKNSFVSGTTVVMADQTRKPIDHIQVGDKVLATDPATGKTRPQTVTTTFTSTGAKNLVRLTIDTDGKHGTKTSTLAATDNHPFWVQAQHKWTNAGQLKPGTLLRTSAGTHVQLTATKTWTQHQTVHNLTVNTDHTYYVLAGTTPVLVHNAGGPGPDEMNLWRAVLPDELSEIHNTRQFRSPQGIKYFSFSEEGAAEYARRMYAVRPQDGPYTTIRTVINRADIPALANMPHTSDVVHGGVALEDDVLPKLGRPRIMPSMSTSVRCP